MSLDLSCLSSFEINSELELLRNLQPPAWQEKAVKLLKSAWNSNLELDVERINNCGLVSKSVFSKIEKAVSEEPIPYWCKPYIGMSVEELYQKIKSILLVFLRADKNDLKQTYRRFRFEIYIFATWFYSSLQNLIKSSENGLKDLQSAVMIARAFEIKEIYKQSHHVFLHSQNSGLLIIPDLIKEFLKAIDLENCPHQFKYLRLPNVERSWDITEYACASDVNDGHGVAREDLLSVDGYFLHKEAWESSIFFLKKNTNIMHSNMLLLQDIIAHFCPDLEVEKIRDFACRVSDITTQDTSKIGNLFLICIPKNLSTNIQYRAHPFGSPCLCHDNSEDLKILDDLQNDILSPKVICSGEHLSCNSNLEEGYQDFDIPQYRLFTPEIKPENGVKIYFIPSDKAYRDLVKQQIKTIVHEILALKTVA